MSHPLVSTFDTLFGLVTGSFSGAVLVFNAITVISCAFFTTPTLFQTLRDHPTPFTPNEYVLAAFVAFMYIMPGLLYVEYKLPLDDTPVRPSS